jgi:hypothetical protein
LEHLSYKIATPHITWEEFDNEYVVLDLESGRYFSFSGGSALVWRGLLAGCSPADLSAEIPELCEARTAFQMFFEALLKNGLFIADDPATVEADIFSAEIAAVGTDFNFESFDDLADLLVADPIHDVEVDAGWPHRQSE